MTEDLRIRPLGAKNPHQRMSPEDRNAQLLSLAVELTAQRGVGRVGHGDIAKAAKVSTGTVFNYFPTMEALNSAVIAKVQAETMGLFTDDHAGKTAASALIFYSQGILHLVETQPAIFKVFLNWSQSFDDPFRTQFLALKTYILEILKPLLGLRGHADTDVHIIYGTGLLYGQMKLEGYSDNDLTKLASRVAELVT